MKKIDWKKGSGTLLLVVCLIPVFLLFMVLLSEVGNGFYMRTVSITRADAIADSSALYAQSFDWKYNKPQAEIMNGLLTMLNNGTSDDYEITSTITFPEDDLLTVNVHAEKETFFPALHGKEVVNADSEVSVRSLDVYGDILYVP